MSKKVKVTKKQRELIEHELRRGTSKSRISTLLDVDYDEGQAMISHVQESIRPEVGDKIKFQFRGNDMVGVIVKLLENSAVVVIYWDHSAIIMREILEEKTIVNFKDIIEFVDLPEQPEDKGLTFETVTEEDIKDE